MKIQDLILENNKLRFENTKYKNLIKNSKDIEYLNTLIDTINKLKEDLKKYEKDNFGC